MDKQIDEGFNFWDYIFFRRVETALDSCGDNGIL